MITPQNVVVVDLLLGMGFNDAFRIFTDHVKTRYDAEPGFITMNMPMLLDVLEQLGINNPIVCSNIDKIGFRVSGVRSCLLPPIEKVGSGRGQKARPDPIAPWLCRP